MNWTQWILVCIVCHDIVFNLRFHEDQQAKWSTIFKTGIILLHLWFSGRGFWYLVTYFEYRTVNHILFRHFFQQNGLLFQSDKSMDFYIQHLKWKLKFSEFQKKKHFFLQRIQRNSQSNRINELRKMTKSWKNKLEINQIK